MEELHQYQTYKDQTGTHSSILDLSVRSRDVDSLSERKEKDLHIWDVVLEVDAANTLDSKAYESVCTR